MESGVGAWEPWTEFTITFIIAWMALSLVFGESQNKSNWYFTQLALISLFFFFFGPPTPHTMLASIHDDDNYTYAGSMLRAPSAVLPFRTSFSFQPRTAAPAD